MQPQKVREEIEDEGGSNKSVRSTVVKRVHLGGIPHCEYEVANQYVGAAFLSEETSLNRAVDFFRRSGVIIVVIGKTLAHSWLLPKTFFMDAWFPVMSIGGGMPQGYTRTASTERTTRGNGFLVYGL